MPQLTAPEILLIIAAIGVVLNNMIQSWRIGTKVAVIEGHVNSKETKYAEQIVSKDNEIQILRNIIVDKDKDKALLAQAVITTSAQAEVVKLAEIKALEKKV